MSNGWHRKPDTANTRQRAREYASPQHRAQVRQNKQLVATGRAVCWRCGGPIPATARCGPDWQTGHDDHDRRIYRGPEHTRCNQRAAALKGAGIANARRRQPRQVIRRRLLPGGTPRDTRSTAVDPRL